MSRARDGSGSVPALPCGRPPLPGPGSVPHGRVLHVGMAELLSNRSLAANLEAQVGVEIRRRIPAHVAVHGVPDQRDWRSIRRLVSNWSVADEPMFALQFPMGILPGCLGRADRFGKTRIYLRADCPGQFESAEWGHLQRCKQIYPFYGHAVRSVCPLLGDQSAGELLPGCELLVPSGSAWIPLRIDLMSFVDRGGKFERAKLNRTLIRCLHAAEILVDHSLWMTDTQQIDAARNRRVAISIDGIGDLVAARGGDPQALETLRTLQQLVADIRDTLISASRGIAGRAGRMPALDRDPLGGTWSSDATAQNWQRRYEEACRQTGTRHRNLLAISPYAVLPKRSVALPAYTDLLPLIAVADAWGFSGDGACRHWSASDARRFHERARAVIDGAASQGRVAGGV